MLGKIEGKRRKEWQRMKWLDSITDLMDMNLSELLETLKDRETWCVTVYGVTKSQTRLSDGTHTHTILHIICLTFCNTSISFENY